MFSKDFSLLPLFDRYANLLTEKQKSAFSLYYNEDFSLSEIAEHSGTSRQAVRSLIQKTEEELRRFEAALHLTQKEEAIQKISERLLSDANEEQKDLVTSLLTVLKE